MLADVLRAQTLPPGTAVLDLCTGSGALAVAAARRGVHDVTAVDVSRRALLCARVNARLNGVRVRTCRGDLFAAVGDARYDVIVSNPPYLPSCVDALPSAGASRAWEAGRPSHRPQDESRAGTCCAGGSPADLRRSQLFFPATARCSWDLLIFERPWTLSCLASL